MARAQGTGTRRSNRPLKFQDKKKVKGVSLNVPTRVKRNQLRSGRRTVADSLFTPTILPKVTTTPLATRADGQFDQVQPSIRRPLFGFVGDAIQSAKEFLPNLLGFLDPRLEDDE